MNDILLTQKQEDVAVEAFVEKYRKQHGGLPPQVCINEERRRAQVRKVVEWLEENNQATEANLPNPAVDGEGVYKGWSGYRIFVGEMLLTADTVAALKAAGEGE